MPTTDEVLHVISTIKADIDSDIRRFEGAPFTGRNVSELFGCQAAAISALCNIIEAILKEELT